MGKSELIAVATLHLTLEETGAVVGVDPVAVGHEENDVAGFVRRDVLVLLLAVADGLVSLGTPVALQEVPSIREVVRVSSLSKFESTTVDGSIRC